MAGADRIGELTDEEIPLEWFQGKSPLSRRSVKRLVHAVMLAELGRGYRIYEDALKMLKLFTELHVSCIMRGTCPTTVACWDGTDQVTNGVR